MTTLLRRAALLLPALITLACSAQPAMASVDTTAQALALKAQAAADALNPTNAPAASAPAGSELISCVQGGVISRCTTAQVATFRYGQPNTIDSVGHSWPAQLNADGGAQRNPAAYSIINQVNALYGQRIRFGLNLGVSGQRSDEWLARGPAVLAGSGGWVWPYGFANDLTGLGGFNATAAQIWNGYLNTARGNPQVSTGVKAFYDQVLASGKRLLLVSEPGVAGMSAAQILERDRLNELMREYAETHEGAYFWDINKAILDSTAAGVAFKAGYSSDGTHLSVRGAYAAAAAAEGQAFANRFPAPLQGLVSTPAEAGQAGYGVRNANPLFTSLSGGTTQGSGTINGSIPSSFYLSCPSGVTANVTSAPGAFGNDVSIAFSSTTASAQCIFYYYWNSTQWAAGDIPQADVRVSVAAGSNDFLQPHLAQFFQADSISTTSDDNYSNPANGSGPTAAYTLYLRTKPFPIPAYTTFNQHYTQLFFTFGTSCTSGAPCTGTATIGQFSVRARYGL